MRAPAHIATVFAVGMSMSMLTDPVSSSFTHSTSTPNTNSSASHKLATIADTSVDADKKASEEEPAKKAQKAEPKKETVKIEAGDSLSAIAKAHDTTWVRLFNANKYIKDPNIIHPNKKLTIPAKGDKLPNRYKKLTDAQVETMPQMSSQQVDSATQPQSATTTSSTPVATKAGSGGANRYSAGQCTWYVKNKRPDIGGMWGNGGYGWLAAAKGAGFSTGPTARPGAIAVMSGHVAYVESVSGGKVHLSEMNYGGGVGVVHTRTAPASSFQYIY